MRIKVNKSVICLCMMAMVMSMTSHAGAQSLGSLLGSVVKGVIGDKLTNESTIIGTWSYESPECQFISDNFLAKAGGAIAVSSVEKKIQPVYEKIGLTESQFTFADDGTFTYLLKGKKISGTYTFDNDAKSISMKSKLGIKITAYVTVTGKDMSLVFDADKLMSALKLITGAASQLSSTASTLNSIANAYDGMRVGFNLKKN